VLLRLDLRVIVCLVHFSKNSFTDTGSLVNNITLMWVYLDKANLSIRPKLNTDKMLQEKGVDEYTNFLPEVIGENIKTYLGGKRKTQRKGKKRKTQRKGKKRKNTKKITKIIFYINI
jgi:hypothetical protein